MKQVSKEIENWIKPYASIVGEKMDVDKDLRKSDPAKYFLRVTLPNKFEKYALALHSYWINENIPNDEIRESQNDDKELDEEDFTRKNWKDFYKIKGQQFELNKAINSTIDLNRDLNHMNNELYPGEGLIDKEHLESIKNIVLKFYGNEEIEVFYHFLSTVKCEKNKLFEGRIKDLVDILKNDELTLTPSLIYSKNQKWVINTDYDLPFSTIGGEAKLIENLIRENPNEFYEIQY